MDKTQDIGTVNRLRRFETLLVLFVALLRTLLVVIALYFWWVYTHPFERPGAIIGASALFALILGAVLSPVLRDMASGSVMMAERWYGVGDHVTIEPFTLQGIVERVTLRSTRIRSLSGETVWVNNQGISAVRVSPRGVSTMAIELYVSDLDRGLELIEETDLRLPNGPLMVVKPLTVMTKTKLSDHLYHITTIGETAPERQWLLEKHSVEIIQELDKQSDESVLQHEPIVRFADTEAERRFARTISNASKPRIIRPKNRLRRGNKKPENSKKDQ
jgi:small conductance mechanosensitive channel